MKLKNGLKSVISRLRIMIFPTLREKEVQRYFADGGDEKFRYNFEHLTSDSLVLDLGGYKGQWASDIYAKYNCNILIFEPVSVYYHKIEDRFKFNKKVKVFHLALGDSQKTEKIGLSGDGSSFFVKSDLTEAIEFEDVVNFFQKENINHIDLMKINIEGGEYDLLKRLIESGLIYKINLIHVQFHDFVFDAQKLMDEICKKLDNTHSRTLQYTFVWENWHLKK